MLAYGLQPIISFYLIIAISQIMGVEGLGTYRTIFNYVAVFQISAAFGLRSLLTREIAQNKVATHKNLVSSSVIALVFSTISGLAMAILVSLLSDNPNVLEGTIYASLSLIALGLADVYEGVLGGFEKLSFVGYAWLVENVVRVAFSLWLLYTGFGIIALVWVFVITRILKTLCYAYFVKMRFADPFGKVDWAYTKVLARQAKTFAMITICVTIYWKADVIMIESMRSEEEVGFYSAAYSFLMISLVFVDSFVNSIYPVLANFFKAAQSQFETACRKALKLLGMATVPISVGFSVEAEKIIALIYGSDFFPSILVLQLLIWTLVPYAISQIFAYALVASNKQKIDLLVNAGSMAANITLNLFLIPKYGFLGATYATLISIHIYVGMQLPFVFPKIIKIPVKTMLNGFVRVAVAAGAMTLTLVFLPEFHVIPRLLIAGLVYLMTLLLCGVFSASDRALVAKVLKRTA